MIALLDDIKQIATILAEGGVILGPTDTIWGIGCDALNEKAVEKVRIIKSRQADNPFILMVNDINMIKEYVESIPPRIETLLALHHQPLTIIYPQAKNLPDYLLGPKGSIGIRMIKEPFCQALISQLGRPMVTTSANVSGQPFPRHFGEVSSSVIRQVDYVVRHRQDDLTSHEPSVVATYDKDAQLVFLRE